MTSSAGRLHRRAEVLWRSAPGFLAVATPDGRVATVTGPGVDVWELLAAPCDIDAIVASLSAQYGGQEGTIRRDVLALVDTMKGGGYVDGDG